MIGPLGPKIQILGLDGLGKLKIKVEETVKVWNYYELQFNVSKVRLDRKFEFLALADASFQWLYKNIKFVFSWVWWFLWMFNSLLFCKQKYPFLVVEIVFYNKYLQRLKCHCISIYKSSNFSTKYRLGRMILWRIYKSIPYLYIDLEVYYLYKINICI